MSVVRNQYEAENNYGTEMESFNAPSGPINYFLRLTLLIIINIVAYIHILVKTFLTCELVSFMNSLNT